ncbi:MAG: PAS domain S-box protein, partial [Candidatus Hydrothermarchaeales archaeon]
MPTQIIHRLNKISLWHFIWISVVFSEILTGIMSVILRGRITYDYLITGGVVSLIVASIVIFLIKQLRETEKRAEQELKRLKDFNEEIVEHSPAGILRLDENLKIIYENPRMKDILGVPKGENSKAMGKDIREVPSVARAGLSEALSDLVQGKEMHGEVPFVSIYNKESTLSIVGVPLIENGEFLGALVMVMDITERKHAEEALKESEEKFKGLAEKSPNMIFINKKGGIVYANEKCEEIMGYKKEELYSPDFDFLSLVAPESVDQVKANFGKHAKGEEIPPYEYTLITKDGKRIDGIHTTRLIKYGGENAILGIITDITERKRAEQELKHSVEELEAVHEIDKNILEKPDLSSLLRFIVGKARELTGTDVAFHGFIEDHVIRHRTFNGIRTNALKNIELKKGMGLGWLVLREKKSVVVEDFFTDKRFKDPPYDAVKKEGLVSFLAVPFLSGKGEPLGVLYVGNRKKTRFTKEQIRTLVTLAGESSMAIEHARLYEETKKAYEDLKSLEQMKDEFFSNVSHELRTPLTSIKSSLDILAEEASKEHKELVSIAERNVDRLDALIGDILYYT